MNGLLLAISMCLIGSHTFLQTCSGKSSGCLLAAEINGWFIAFIICVPLAVLAVILLILYIIRTKRKSDEAIRSPKNGTNIECIHLMENQHLEQSERNPRRSPQFMESPDQKDEPNGRSLSPNVPGDQGDGRSEYQHQVSRDDDNNISDLHKACRNGDLESVQHIIKSRKENINVRGRLRMTPIMEATAKGHKQVIDFLLESNCDLSLQDIHKNTVMHFACDRNNVSLVEDLLKQKNPPGINDRGLMGRSPLFIAARNGYSELFDLLKNKSGDIHATDDYNNTILSVACCNNTNKDFVRNLLKLNIFNINARGYKGRTPLMIAAYKGILDIVKILWNYKECDQSVTDDKNDSILNVVCYNDNEDVMKYLLPLSSDINIKGRKGRTPVMIAARNGCIRVFHLLVENKCDLTLCDVKDDTVLHLACCTNDVKIVKYLLRVKRLNIEERGHKGRTPVLVAAFNGCIEVVDFLIREGCDVTVKDDYNDTIQTISHGNMTRYFSSQNSFREIAKT